MKIDNKEKRFDYLIISLVTLLVVLLYWYTRDCSFSEYICIDNDKSIDDFVNNIMISDSALYSNIFEYCDYNIQNILILLICKIFKNPILGINIYYLASFWMISVSSYWALRKFGIERIYAGYGAILLSIIPFHVDRGQGQILTSNFFMVPTIVALFYEMLFEEKYKFEISKCKLIILGLLPFVDIRLSIMTLILFICLAIHKNTKKSFMELGIYGGVLATMICILKILKNKYQGGDIDEIIALSKSEGLRLLDFFMPVRRHFMDRLFNLRYDYDVEFGASGESGLNSFGLLLTAVFIVGGVMLLREENENSAIKIIKWLTWIDVLVILFSNINGFGIILEYAGLNVIYWNRMGIFIIVNTVISLGIIANMIFLKISLILGKRFCYVIYAVVGLSAFADIFLRHAPV